MTQDQALAIVTPFIAEEEGFRSEPYLDGGNVWTIGYGFTFTADGKPVCATTPAITQPDAYARLETMVARVLASVRTMVEVPITNHAAGACASLAYNCGTYALRNSTLMRLLNGNDMNGAAGQFAAWVHDAAGRVEPGLVTRRKAEAEMFLTADDAAEPVQELHELPSVPTAADLNAAELVQLNPTPEQS
jgi:lysozyme